MPIIGNDPMDKILNRQVRGALRIRFDIVFPTRLSAEKREALIDILNEQVQNHDSKYHKEEEVDDY